MKAWVCVLIAALAAGAAFGDEAGIRAGLASVDITPPLGGRLSGYSPGQITTKVHDPLMAKVLVLESTQSTVALVTWDVCEFQSPWLRDQMPALGIDRLLLLSSHTHAGPNLYQRDFPSGEKPILRITEEKILSAVREARSNLFPAHFAAGEGSIQLGYNRLVPQPGGWSLTHFENPERIPYGPADPVVGVIRVTDDNGAVRAVLVSYACHPVVLGPKNTWISADYPGVMYRKVEEELGGGAMCLFFQGGGGDINPLFLARTGEPEDDFPLVERMGLILADEVLETLDGMKDVPGRSEQMLSSSKTIMAERRWEEGEPLRFGVTAILINNGIGIVTMPGEPFQFFQRSLRDRAGLPHAFLLGYCDDSYQDWPNYYLPDIQSAARGGYGASDTGIAAVGTGERLLNEGLIQLYELRGRLRDEPMRHARN